MKVLYPNGGVMGVSSLTRSSYVTGTQWGLLPNCVGGDRRGRNTLRYICSDNHIMGSELFTVKLLFSFPKFQSS